MKHLKFLLFVIIIFVLLLSCSKKTTETEPIPAVQFVYVPGGTFTMGGNKGSWSSDELTTHQVTLSPFYIGKYEVTQAEWQAVMGNSPCISFVGDNYPVFGLSWYAILKFCNLLSMYDGLTPVYSISGSTNPANWGEVPTGYNTAWDTVICDWNANGYRLPTEAEWEYAARGATNYPDFMYSGSDYIDYVAWYSLNNTPTGSKPVGGKAPNGLGLHDMSGNVYEWCWDWYGSYSSAAQSNPIGPSSGGRRVLRGGYWNDVALNCRVTNRYYGYPYYGYFSYGFRIVRAN